MRRRCSQGECRGEGERRGGTPVRHCYDDLRPPMRGKAADWLTPLFLDVRVPRQLQIGQPHVPSLRVSHHAVAAREGFGRVDPVAAEQRYVVVLLDAVTADAQAADDAVAAIERHAAREPDEAALVEERAVAAARRSGPLPARVLRVEDVEVEPGAVLRLAVLLFELLAEIDAWRKQRLAGEADRARGDGPAFARGRLRRPR